MKSAAIRADESHCRADESEDINMSEHLEVRVARIESDVKHISEVTTDLRMELRRTNDKIDALDEKFNGKFDAFDGKLNDLDKKFEGKFDALDKKFDGKFDSLDKKFEGKFDALGTKFDGLKDKLNSVALWALLLYFALAGSLLTVMAKGFKWI
jgi:uncharacterized coiled-coil protein SlyX